MHGVSAAVDAQTLGGAITQAVGLADNDDSFTNTAGASGILAVQIAAAISQASLPSQVALQGYAYALLYSHNPFTGQVVLNAAISEGQLTPLLTQASVARKCLQAMWNTVHACVHHRHMHGLCDLGVWPRKISGKNADPKAVFLYLLR